MNGQVASYRLIWEPMARRGEVAFVTEGSQSPTRIPVVSPEEFSAITAIFRTSPVFWNGRYFMTGEGAAHQMSEQNQFGLYGFDLDTGAQRIITVCEQEWPSNKGDCSGFVRAVASNLGVSLPGNANQIVDTIRESSEWEKIPNGKEAKNAAESGKLVIAGLRGDQQETPDAHGHVVVVVSGPLDRAKYPTAYWGRLGGVGERYKTVNWAWRAGDRDKLIYAAKSV